MNNYLASSEKAQFIRIMHMTDVLEEAIDIYAGLDSTDKTFLSELRHGRTRINKAVTIRRSALNKESDQKLKDSVAKIHPIFVPTPEAKKAYKEISELQSTLPMDIEDLQDWYGFVIEFTCKSCTKTDYEECPARRVLSKYENCPMDPGAKNKCQYNYGQALVPNADYNQKEPLLIDDLWQQIADLKEQLAEYDRLKMELNTILHPAGGGPVNPSMCDIVAYVRSDWKRFEDEISQHQTKYDQLTDKNRQLVQEVEELTAQQIADEIYSTVAEDYESDSRPVVLVLNNGTKRSIDMPEHMAARLIEDIQRPNRYRSICAQYLDDQFVAIDMQEVVALQVVGLPDGEWVRPQTDKLAHEFITEQERYRVECKCGSEYFATMNAGRAKANCRECKYTVFADRQVDKIIDTADGAEATLLTNRYFVSSEPQRRQFYAK